jgi:signal transduction histidine kinase
MSHEIRTPLNAIVGLCEDIAINDELPESMKEDVEDILSSSHTLLEIVGNIMDINKIESNKIELNETTYNIRQEIENIFKLNSSRIGNKEIDYRINIDSNIPNKLIGDKNYINQILNNLLSNAIKYTDKGIIELNINCKIKKEKCILTIIVKDTGKGIKQENINKIFNKFERLDIEPNTTIEGSGLGLSITQKLVELMEGEINVKSTYGKGSIFIITIPQKIPTKIKELTDNQIIRLNNISDEFNDKKDKWSNVEKHIIVDSTNKER